MTFFSAFPPVNESSINLDLILNSSLSLSLLFIGLWKDRGGRFLKQNKVTKLYHEIEDSLARRKTSQLLRDAKPKKSKKISDALESSTNSFDYTTTSEDDPSSTSGYTEGEDCESSLGTANSDQHHNHFELDMPPLQPVSSSSSTVAGAVGCAAAATTTAVDDEAVPTRASELWGDVLGMRLCSSFVDMVTMLFYANSSFLPCLFGGFVFVTRLLCLQQ